MKDLIIIGASGFGRETAWIVERINEIESTWNLLGFLDDNRDIQGTFINGYQVLGTIDDICKYECCYFVCAIGASKTRKKIIEKLPGGIKYATLVDPSVETSKWNTVGEGSIICAHTIMTVNVNIGKHVIINLDCTVGHSAILNDYVTLYPSVNVSGDVTVKPCVELGTGMQVIQGKTIGENSILGAGAIAINDIPANCTAVGSPAKPIKYSDTKIS